MHGSKTDEKNIQLLKLLAQLRDHIDIHRIIGLNFEALRKAQISGALLGYLQKSAHESLAIYICKIFESSTRNDLNSIPGIIESIPATSVSEMQSRELAVFGKKYGHDVAPTDARSYLRDTFELFASLSQSHLADSKSSETQSAPIVITAPTSRLFRRMLSSRAFSALQRTSTKSFRTRSSRAGPQ